MSREELARWVAGGVLAAALALPGCGSDDDAPTVMAEAPAAETPAAVTEEPTAPGAVHTPTRTRTADGSNAAPVIESARLDPERPGSGAQVRVVVKASDPDGDPVHVSYAWRLDGRPVQGDRDRVVLQGFRKNDGIQVIVTPSDGQTTGEPVTLHGRVANQAPDIQSVRIDPAKDIVAGAELHARVNANDNDLDRIELEYEWKVNGRRQSGGGETFGTRGLNRGDQVEVAVRASDGSNRSERKTSAAVKIGNTPPEIVSAPEAPGPDGVFRYQAKATDPDGDRGIIFSLAEAPEGMTVDRTSGEVLWEPTEEQAGTFPVAVIADDRKGGKARQEFELTVGSAAPAAPKP